MATILASRQFTFVKVALPGRERATGLSGS